MRANPENAGGEVTERGRILAGGYEVESLVGESPAGRLYLVREQSTTRNLCVKLFNPEVSARLRAAPDFFLRAARMVGISHDNLCPCHDVREDGSQVLVARDYVEGLDFEDWNRANHGGDQYFSRGLELVWQASQGLAALHERSRHLAIHPGNVIVGTLSTQLCDWDPRFPGNMEMTPESLPVRAEFLGYRAPETRRPGGFLSHPGTDLFAAAGLLFRLLTGHHPSPNPDRTLEALQTLDKDAARFLAKALHPHPDERYTEAEAFGEALWELRGSVDRWSATARPVAAQNAALADRGDTIVGSPELVPAPVHRRPSALPSFTSPPTLPPVASLSSLERDPLDTLSGDMTQGYTRFGFKGAGEDSTGEFARNPEGSARRKLGLVWVGAGFLILAFTAAATLFILGGVGSLNPPRALAMLATLAKKQDRPAETPAPIPPASKAGLAKTQEEKANLRVGIPPPESLTADQWLKRADDFNDSGKIAEANAAYAKVLLTGNVASRQKIRALGGLAITFQGLGEPEKAREAVEKILVANPRNAFALRMKERLR